ncbi:MAG: class I poly(R)-hydroxyalkanoic acid synthase [Candidatus Dactylopiibacterium sp.]|nr:class I poly(R)-hydroxyalkanoic acid synthase [Candidatus Dactylopiibacterium sp.]
MSSEQSQAVLDGWMQAGQQFMEGFFRQFGQKGPFPDGTMPALPALSREDAAWLALQQEHARRHTELWQSIAQRKPGEAVAPVVPSAATDRRFNAPEWAESPVFDYIRQAYLLNAGFLGQVAERLPVSDAAQRNRLQFMMRQCIDAMAPSNFAATNPEVVRKALDTQGESLTQGLLNLIGDVEKGRISMTDEAAFEVGRNLATTPGAVIFENEVMQLLQYAPQTATVCKTPLLIVPPCINKFYILDLQAENSFVRHAVEQGITVFLVSWRNPQAGQSHLGWDDYLDQGILSALKVVRAVTRVKKPNVLGFCIGGTLLAAALAVLRARGEDPVESVTFLTTMLDFSETGDIACYVDETSVSAQEAGIGRGGLMAGREFSQVFSSLRPNDLVWNYVVDNYLKGNKPAPFDLLYWNADSTNLPGPFAAYYLRNTYLENRLREPGALTMLGEPVDLGLVDCPAYFVAAREDHIVPWRTSYLGRRLLGGDTIFVLGASGHIAGVVNPPAKMKRSYWTNDADPASSEEWFAGASETRGSWWPHWAAWLRARSGAQVKAREPGSRTYPPRDAAPGSYVKVSA